MLIIAHGEYVYYNFVIMKIDAEKLLESICNGIDEMGSVDPSDIPGLDLYMDQVTTFVGEHLKNSTRNPESDKILTKTMINNYAKSGLLPPPVKKKYTKEHMMYLLMIFYLKGVMSIGDITALLEPMTKEVFGRPSGIGVEDIYAVVSKFQTEQNETIKKDIEEKIAKAEKILENISIADSDESIVDKNYIKIFSLVSLLGYDAYVKQLVISKIIDDIISSDEPAQDS